MSGLHVTVLSGVLALLGVVLLLAGKGEAMATVLITAGVGTLTTNAALANRNAKASERKAKVANDELERTQSFLRESGIHRRD